MGLAVGGIICGAALTFGATFPFLEMDTVISQSTLAPLFLKYLPVVLGLLPEEFDLVLQLFP